jgi:hypothetical protein
VTLLAIIFFFQELANATVWGNFPFEDRKVLMRQVLRSRASSTVKKYVREHRKYINFLVRTKRPATLPSEKLHIASYLASVSQTKNSYNAVLQAFFLNQMGSLVTPYRRERQSSRHYSVGEHSGS